MLHPGIVWVHVKTATHTFYLIKINQKRPQFLRGLSGLLQARQALALPRNQMVSDEAYVGQAGHIPGKCPTTVAERGQLSYSCHTAWTVVLSVSICRYIAGQGGGSFFSSFICFDYPVLFLTLTGQHQLRADSVIHSNRLFLGRVEACDKPVWRGKEMAAKGKPVMSVQAPEKCLFQWYSLIFFPWNMVPFSASTACLPSSSVANWTKP